MRAAFLPPSLKLRRDYEQGPYSAETQLMIYLARYRRPLRPWARSRRWTVRVARWIGRYA